MEYVEPSNGADQLYGEIWKETTKQPSLCYTEISTIQYNLSLLKSTLWLICID